MRKQIVNGKVYDWSSVTIDVSGCSGVEPSEINYDQSAEKELIHGKGGRIRGIGTGKRENSVKLTVLREDYNTMIDALKCPEGIIDPNVVIPKITVAFADPGCTTSVDTLTKVVFTKETFKSAEGDTSERVELEGMAVGGIKHS